MTRPQPWASTRSCPRSLEFTTHTATPSWRSKWSFFFVAWKTASTLPTPCRTMTRHHRKQSCGKRSTRLPQPGGEERTGRPSNRCGKEERTPRTWSRVCTPGTISAASYFTPGSNRREGASLRRDVRLRQGGRCGGRTSRRSPNFARRRATRFTTIPAGTRPECRSTFKTPLESHPESRRSGRPRHRQMADGLRRSLPTRPGQERIAVRIWRVASRGERAEMAAIRAHRALQDKGT
mmetsp:Transcript_3512/g.8353  ORF Transcript_3512/g.8353 Transcript_3512/m.8353 type:complete len:236 (+) Transcript_3512:353-1060(+)